MLLDMRPRGTITRYTRSDGSHFWRVRVTELGQRKSLGAYDSEAMAEDVLAAYIATVGPAKELTLREWGKLWLNARETDKVHRGVKIERSVWKRHVLAAPFADLPLRHIKRGHVVRWVKERLTAKALVVSGKGHAPGESSLSASAVKSALSLLKGALHDACDEGRVPSNVAADVRVPKQAQQHEGWTWLRQHEADHLLGHVSMTDKQRAAVTVAIYTGLRAGELWGLRWCDVDLDGARPSLHVRRSYRGPTKSGRVRFVPLLEPAHVALKAWKKAKPGIGAGFVFASHGRGCHGQSYDAGWADSGTKARPYRGIASRADFGRHVRFHDLRHTCASHLVQGTWTRRALSLEQVKKWLGHSTVAVTERYSHLAPDYLLGLDEVELMEVERG